MIRVALPAHLRTLGRIAGEGEIGLAVEGPVTQRSVLDALEAEYPMLRGTLRDHVTKQRRAFVRFFACGEDWSHRDMDAELPAEVAGGTEPFLIVGAVAGGCSGLATADRVATGVQEAAAGMSLARSLSRRSVTVSSRRFMRA